MAQSGQGEWELSTAEELRRRHGLDAEAHRQIKLNPERVPENLRHLIPLAEVWAENDDLIRDDMVARAPADARARLLKAVQEAEDELDAWLAGPEAANPSPSPEYCAFTTMVMAASS